MVNSESSLQQSFSTPSAVEQPSAWVSLESVPYTLPVTRSQPLLHREPELPLPTQKSTRSPFIAADIVQMADSETLPQSNQANQKTAQRDLRQLKTIARKAQAEHEWDSLTGLHRQQSLVAGQAAPSLANRVARTTFNPNFGYGLVNAAKAVAWSAGYYPYSLLEVRDLGGDHWGNDLVKAPEAWAQGVTGRGVTVAVIDSGVDITHPDLRNNIWRNPGEIAGDGIDNDRNGYVDDLFGWNFGANQNNNNVLPGTSSRGQSHGTHVAGTIAAGANGFGTTGIAPNAKIMALRLGNVGNDTRFTNPGSLAEAIRYAVNNGAKVVNLSLGWSDSPALRNALTYAASRNVIVVSAAGNQGLASPNNPAQYATHLGVSVGAIDRFGRLANFSNRAGWDSRMQHVVAPGVDVVSTVPLSSGRAYEPQNGTSMAAPHVAGVVALMLSANPNLTHAQVRYILTQSATA